ncbi:hypothetical protein ARC78_15030 [Stenotrophomonas pictorum JCM 9942]|uniref:DUF4224 domain-containing protein n=1 Tax=Stenotrophomonas pictorum JCM 9942 TaxID=1236960 RepID=A0A0R0A2Y0_9GAMM|nr:DUF4224 domain-containing protein [Stenotrophomonas pictorum]KRG39129.1 hypothetical protein ARC78_15030 [Stenotrophomonas pictorum JCM 9942]
MADGIALSKQEVAQLCRTPQKARQVAFLSQNGIRHYLDGHGWPVVLRSTIDGLPAQEAAGTPTWKPNKAA